MKNKIRLINFRVDESFYNRLKHLTCSGTGLSELIRQVLETANYERWEREMIRNAIHGDSQSSRRNGRGGETSGNKSTCEVAKKPVAVPTRNGDVGKGKNLKQRRNRNTGTDTSKGV